MKRLLKLSVCLFIVLSLNLFIISCKTVKNDNTGISDINGTWILKTLNGQVAADVFKGKIPVMNINMTENRISGNGGCNSYTGKFTLDKGVFSAPNVAATMMMCVVENQEPQFFAMLAKQNNISLVNGTLILKNAGQNVAEFVRGTDQALLSGKWTLEFIDGEDMNSLFTVSEKMPTIEFLSQDGRISGNAGCNGYGATYKIDGSTIDVGPVMSTKMACPNLKGESLFVKMLSGKSELSVAQKELSFLKDGKTVLKFKK